MKKLLLLLVFALTSAVSFSQIVYLRANQFNIGYRESENSKISWGEASDVNILIQVEQNKATIFSKEKQVYRLISLLEKRDDYTKYYCTNSEGSTCYILIFTLTESPGVVFFAIEFSDFVWYYATKPE